MLLLLIKKKITERGQIKIKLSAEKNVGDTRNGVTKWSQGAERPSA